MLYYENDRAPLLGWCNGVRDDTDHDRDLPTAAEFTAKARHAMSATASSPRAAASTAARDTPATTARPATASNTAAKM